MIKIFNGEWRGIGKKKKRMGLMLEFEFRDYLHHFKGAKLGVFMCICLHSDDKGRCFPDYDLIMAETGYKRAAVASAIDDLCKLKIEGTRILCLWRTGNGRGHSNQYQIFPTQGEILFAEEKMELIGKGSKIKPFSSPEKSLKSEPIKGSEIKPITPIKGLKSEREVKPVKNKPIKDKPKRGALPQSPSLPRPNSAPWERQTPSKQKALDAIVGKAGDHGLSPKQFRGLTNAVLEGVGLLALADAGDDRALQDAQAAALKLVVMGRDRPELIRDVFESWYLHDWRGQKGELPNYERLLEHASKMATGQLGKENEKSQNGSTNARQSGSQHSRRSGSNHATIRERQRGLGTAPDWSDEEAKEFFADWRKH